MRGKKTSATTAEVVTLLEKQLIVQLGLAGVPQRTIREIVACDLNRVTRIMKHLKRYRADVGEERA